MSFTKVFIQGRLSKEPTMKQVGSQNVCSFSIAVNTPFKDNAGNYISNFYDCSFWGKQGESFANKAKKGMPVSAAGTVGMVSYMGNDGRERQSLRVTVDTAEVITTGGTPQRKQTGSEDESPF